MITRHDIITQVHCNTRVKCGASHGDLTNSIRYYISMEKENCHETGRRKGGAVLSVNSFCVIGISAIVTEGSSVRIGGECPCWD